MSHLGDRVAPLVDGQLMPEQAERANMHIAGCAGCREAVELERATKQHLAALGPIEPRADFLRQLMEMAGPSGPLPPRPGHVPGSPRPEYVRPVPAFAADGAALPSAPDYPAEVAYRAYGDVPYGSLVVRERPPVRRGSVRPAGGRGLARVAPALPSRANRTKLAVAMVGAACLVGAGVAGGAVSASGPSGRPASPAIATFVGEHAAYTTSLPLTATSLTYGTAGAGR